MKRLIKILAIIILLAAAYSFIPVVALYLGKDYAPHTNDYAVEKLKNNSGGYFEFVVFGDNHSGLIFDDSATLKLVRGINREGRFKKVPVDFVAVAGDATFRGEAWDYKIYNKIRSLIKWPVITAMGNHDKDKGGIKHFKKYMGKDEIAFHDRNSYFIVIDNVINDLTEEQFSRVEDEFKNSSAYAHRFVIMHKLPISPYQQSWYRPELSLWSYRFMKLCEKYNVDIVFGGHEHMFKELNLGGVKYITSGGGGMITHTPRYDGGFLHYIVVKVYGDYVSYEVRKIFPPLWEFFTYYMWKDIFYFLKDAL